MANANIFQQYLQPVKSVADYAGEYARNDALSNQNALQKMAIQQQQQTTEQATNDRNALQRIAQASGGNRDSFIQGLRQSGSSALMGQADALEKSGADLTVSKSTAAKNNAEAGATTDKTQNAKSDRAIADISNLLTPQDAITSLNAHHAAGDIDDVKYQSVLQTLAPALRDPTQFGSWKRNMVIGIMDAKDRIAATAPKVTMQNAGGSFIPVNENADAGPVGAVAGAAPIPITQSADSKASTGLGYAKLGEEKRHNGATEAQATAGGAGGASTKPLTEDQGKATGWLIQAGNAFKNMQAAASKDPSATEPGINDGIEAIGLPGLANKMRGGARQQFMQASSSLSEALLRAATGAGVNESEAKQKIAELTPVYGDGQDVVKQKFDAIPLYIDSLKVRAGPGAPKAEAVLGNRSAAPAAPTDVPADIQAILDRHGKK